MKRERGQPSKRIGLIPGTWISTADGPRVLSALSTDCKLSQANGGHSTIRCEEVDGYVGNTVRIKACGLLPVCLLPSTPVWVAHALPGRGKGAARKFAPPRWIPADGVRLNDLLFVPRFRRNFPVPFVHMIGGPRTRNCPIVRVSSSFLRMVGLYLAEGSVRADGRTVQFTFNRGERAYASCVKEWASSNGFGWSEALGAGTLVVYVYGKAAACFLELTFGQGAWNKRFPHWFFSLPQNQQWETVGHYFRGDACLWDPTRSAYTASTRSEALARSLQMVLARCGCATSLAQFEDHGKPSYRITISGTNVVLAAKMWSLPLPERKYRFTHFRVTRESVCCPVRSVAALPYDGPTVSVPPLLCRSVLVPFIVKTGDDA